MLATGELRCAIPRARPSSARLALKGIASLGVGSLGPYLAAKEEAPAQQSPDRHRVHVAGPAHGGHHRLDPVSDSGQKLVLPSFHQPLWQRSGLFVGYCKIEFAKAGGELEEARLKFLQGNRKNKLKHGGMKES